jgi:hypothetical protein
MGSHDWKLPGTPSIQQSEIGDRKSKGGGVSCMSRSATELRLDRSAEGDGRRRVLVMVDAPERDEIAELAYQMWVKRGRPDGSPDEDWLRAEEELLHHRALDHRA